MYLTKFATNKCFFRLRSSFDEASEATALWRYRSFIIIIIIIIINLIESCCLLYVSCDGVCPY